MAEIAYLDESYDERVFVMSALIIPVHSWTDTFVHIQNYRRFLKQRYGIFTSKELHATDFVAGRGRIAPRAIPKAVRAQVFLDYLQLHTQLPVRIISGAWARSGITQPEIHAKAFSRIQERLQRRCVSGNSQIITIVDEGRANELRRVARRSRIWNPVGSQFGAWSDGSSYKNIPNDRLIEDPIFKPSHQSYFLQSADFIAFALLKSEVPPTPHIRHYGLDRAYDLLQPVCAVEASPREPRGLGIVRT